MDICRNCGKSIFRCACKIADVFPPVPHEEARASRMPSHLPTVDPIFIDAVFREFAPDERALLEKTGGRG